MGWFRFVCSNGLIIGVTRSDMRRRHLGNLRLEDVGLVLESGLKEAEIEKKNFEKWRKVEITLDRLAPWVNKQLWKGWGFKAAARTFHIARCGANDASDCLVGLLPLPAFIGLQPHHDFFGPSAGLRSIRPENEYIKLYQLWPPV